MSRWEVEELAATIIAKGDEEKAEKILEDDDIESVMFDELEMDFDVFYDTVQMLLKYTYPVKSALTDQHYYAFGVLNNHGFRAIVQEEA